MNFKIALALLVLISMLTCVSACAQTQLAAAAKPADKKIDADAPFDQQKVLEKYYNSPADTVVGTAGSVKVTKGELMEALWHYGASTLLNSLISQKLIEQGARKEGIITTKAEINAKAIETARTYGFKNIEELARARRLSTTIMLNDLKINLLLEKLGRRKAAATPEEIGSYVLARHILVRFPNVMDEVNETKRKEIAKQRIDEVAEKLKAGGDFAELAAEHSEDSTRSNGGLLDWATKGSWVKEFEDAVFALKPGEVSDPVESIFGYHIIKLEKTGDQASAEEKKNISERIVTSKLQSIVQTWMQNLNEENKIDNKLVDPSPMPQPGPVVRPQGEQLSPDVPDLPPPPPSH